MNLSRRCCSLFIVIFVLSATNNAHSMPDELFKGMVLYEIESDNAFRALSLMDEEFERTNYVNYLSALQGFNIHGRTTSILDSVDLNNKNLQESDFFNIGKAEYHADRCIPALKAFKRLKNKLTIEQKQEWAYYRANCFIKLGSNARAAQVLSSDLLTGIWISHAYYNLAISYADTSTSKRKAIAILLIAESLIEGKNPVEHELADRINLAAGSLYIEEGNLTKAIESLNKVHLESSSSATALYLRGVAHLESNDFRAATQSWVSVKSYPVIQDGVAESYLAIPFAYEGSGYIGQALQAYTEAAETFQDELNTITKIEKLIKKHGVRKVFIERNNIKGLEWFLAKDIATNTLRATYYSYFMRDQEIYDNVELFSELKRLEQSLSYWRDQLKVFDKALSKKNRNFAKKSKTLNVKRIKSQLAKLEKKQASISAKAKQLPALGLEEVQELPSYISTIKERLSKLTLKTKEGEKRIKGQLKRRAKLDKRVGAAQKNLQTIMSSLEQEISEQMLSKLKTLRIEMLFNYEKADQGLVNILETVAESSNRKRKKRKLKDGLYK